MSIFVVPKEEKEWRSFREETIREEFDTVNEFSNYLDGKFFEQFSGEAVPKFGDRAKAGNDLHVIPGVTELSKDELIRRLSGGGKWDERIDYGDAVSLLIENENSGTGVYLSINDPTEKVEDTPSREPGYFILFSNLTKDQYVDSPLMDRVGRVPRTSSLHVSTWRLKRLVDNLVINSENAYSDRIIFKRPRNSDTDTEVGDSKTKRTINYYGDDAGEVVPYMSSKLGMRIDSVRFVLSNASFEVNQQGVLSLHSGKGNALSTLLESVRDLIEETLDVKSAYASAESRRIEILSGDETVSQSQPAVIHFNRKVSEDGPVTGDTIHDLFEELADNGIVPVSRYVEEEELYYSTNVYHTTHEEYFDIRGNQESLRVFPREGERDLDTFFSMLEVIQSIISQKAYVKTDDADTRVDGGQQ